MKNVLSLRPTQFVLGVREVESKVKRIKSFNKKQLKNYIDTHRVPVVKNKGLYYIVDHHHFVRACWEAGIKKVHVKVIQKYNFSDDRVFWNYMKAANYTYLIDQLGHGPNDPRFLPEDIRCMADDPYRSLAWAVREAGGFNKIDVPFSEFKWANYLRKKVNIVYLRKNFDKAAKEAVEICLMKEASKLPGFKK